MTALLYLIVPILGVAVISLLFHVSDLVTLLNGGEARWEHRFHALKNIFCKK